MKNFPTNLSDITSIHDVGGYDVMHPKYGSNGALGVRRISTNGLWRFYQGLSCS